MENMMRVLLGPVPVWKTLTAVALWLFFAGLIADLNATEWASWVQAVGSIGAIVGSFALARNEAKSANEDHQLRNSWQAFHHAQLASSIASDVERALLAVERKLSKSQVHGRSIGNERLLQVQRVLDAMSLRDLSPVLLTEILALHREVAYSLTAVRELGPGPASDARVTGARKRLEKVRCSQRRINEQVVSYARTLNVHDDS